MGKSNDFNRIAAELEAKAASLVTGYQGFWLDAAMQLAPVATIATSGYEGGDLRASGTMAPGDGPLQAKVVFTSDHAAPQEFGTVDMPPQPFLRPSKDALRGPFQRDLKGLLK